MRSWEALLRTDSGRLRLWWRLAAFVLVTLVGAAIVALLLPPGLLGGALGLLAGALLASWWLLRLDGRGVGALGFHLSTEAIGESVGGVALGTTVGLVVVGLMLASGVVEWIPAGPSGVGTWLSGSVLALLYLSVPAASEEVVLRGYPFQALAEAWGPVAALIATSVVFGLLHLGNPGAGALATVNVVAAGLMLGVVYLRTASLWWVTGVHVGWNWAHGYVADVPVSGLEVVDPQQYDGVTSGPAWLGGGDFGPEGSVLSTLVLLGVTAVVWWGPWPRAGYAARATRPLVGPLSRGGRSPMEETV